MERIVEGGDHMIVLGRVVAADQNDSDPLNYHRRVFDTPPRTGNGMTPKTPATAPVLSASSRH